MSSPLNVSQCRMDGNIWLSQSLPLCRPMSLIFIIIIILHFIPTGNRYERYNGQVCQTVSHCEDKYHIWRLNVSIPESCLIMVWDLKPHVIDSIWDWLMPKVCQAPRHHHHQMSGSNPTCTWTWPQQHISVMPWMLVGSWPNLLGRFFLFVARLGYHAFLKTRICAPTAFVCLLVWEWLTS